VIGIFGTGHAAIWCYGDLRASEGHASTVAAVHFGTCWPAIEGISSGDAGSVQQRCGAPKNKTHYHSGCCGKSQQNVKAGLNRYRFSARLAHSPYMRLPPPFPFDAESSKMGHGHQATFRNAHQPDRRR
ncbi:MAG TPA: hypothetical protein VD840_14435, partial [Sinorhizobium sp.]|nr:hypothetical protein [Sinorhizobium sp.]